MRIGKNTPWLVKSGGRIIGPFFENEIISLLRTREIVLIDELSRPCGRWVYIRDEPTFAGITEELRQKNLKTLNDETTAQIEHTVTPTATISVTDKLIDDRTEEISNIIEINSENRHQIKEILEAAPSSKSQKSNILSDETYVFEGDASVQKETQAVSKWMWAFAAVVIFGSLGYVAFRQYIAKPIQTKAIALASLEKATAEVEDGFYSEAFNLYKKAFESYPDDQRIYLPLSLLYLHEEGQTVIARRLLEKLLAQQEKDRQKILTAAGLADLYDRRLPEAEARFLRALDVDPLFKPALINLGAAALAGQDYEKANNHLQIAIKDGSREGLEQIMLAEVLSRLYEKEKDKTYLQQAEKYLNEYLNPSRAYYLEALVASIYIHHLNQEKEKIYTKINLFLNADPMGSSLHKTNLYLFSNSITWTKLNQWCLQSTAGLDPLARLVAFEALCLLKANDLTEASRKMEDAVQQAPRDPLIQAVYGYVLENLNATDRARAAYEKSVDFDREQRFESPRILMARYCAEQGQTDCAAQYWRELYNLNTRSLPALAGLAQSEMTQGSRDKAKEYIRSGLTLTNTYRPFILASRLVGP